MLLAVRLLPLPAEFIDQPLDCFLRLNEVLQEGVGLKSRFPAVGGDDLDRQGHKFRVQAERLGEVVDRCLPDLLVRVQDGWFDLGYTESHVGLRAAMAYRAILP